MTETIFGKWCGLAQVSFADIEGAGFMTYTATSHQGAIKRFWQRFILSIFIYTNHVVTLLLCTLFLPKYRLYSRFG